MLMLVSKGEMFIKAHKEILLRFRRGNLSWMALPGMVVAMWYGENLS